MNETQMSLLNNTPIRIAQIAEGQPLEILDINKKVLEEFLQKPMDSFEIAFQSYCEYTHVKASGKTHPFIQAIKNKDMAIANAFLVYKNRGFDINCMDELGRTAAHAIAATGNIAFLNKFKKVLDWEKKDKFGNRPIHIATTENKSEMVKVLATLGVDLDARNNAHITASQMAEEEGHNGVLDALLESGATEIFD